MHAILQSRYALHMFLATKRKDWHELDKITGKKWIERGAGKRAYDVLWRKLLELTFFEFAEDISAAWIWARVKRVETSRRSLSRKELGYIDEGSETLVKSLVMAFEGLGGRLHLATPVQQVLTQDGRVSSVRVGDKDLPADAVISTVPTPLVPILVPDLDEEDRAKYVAILNIGVVCVIFGYAGRFRSISG